MVNDLKEESKVERLLPNSCNALHRKINRYVIQIY